MGARFRWRILQFAVLVLPTAGIVAAQNRAGRLPDAPTPMLNLDFESSSHIPTRGIRSKPEQFVSTSLSTRQKYRLAWRRVFSPQLPLRAGLVSGWELGTGTGPDFPTNGWGPFAERFGYNRRAARRPGGQTGTPVRRSGGQARQSSRRGEDRVDELDALMNEVR